jgi:hypothetical protein
VPAWGYLKVVKRWAEAAHTHLWFNFVYGRVPVFL